ISHDVTPTVRMRGYAVWDVVTFLLNGLVFILIGFALPQTLEGIGGIPTRSLIWYAALISITTIVVRLLWVFPAAYLPRWLIPGLARREPKMHLSCVAMIGWTGMRGIVSLAAALALPRILDGGAGYPERNL